MNPEMKFMRRVDDDTAVVPGTIVAVRTWKIWNEEATDVAWGVEVLLVGGMRLYRPAREDTQESARELLEQWVAFANGKTN